MYEDDTPPAERRAQALSLDRDLLKELLGQEELRELIDPGALEEVETQLRGDAAQRRTSCTTCCGCAATCARASSTPRSPSRCSTSGARSRVRIAGEERLVAAEDAGRYRDALGAMPPGGLPEAFLEGGAGLARRASSRASPRAAGRSRPREANDHFGHRRRAACCASSSGRSGSSAASFGRAGPSASGAIRTSCAACAAPRSPRCARRSSPPSRRRSGASCRAGTGSTGARRCARRSSRSRRSRFRSSLWESEVLPRRVPDYQPAQLDQLCATRRARLGRRRARPRRGLLPRGRAGARPARRRPSGPKATSTTGSARCSARGAEFWFDLLAATRARGRAGAARRSGISSGPAR